jgi:hypothetical protein
VDHHATSIPMAADMSITGAMIPVMIATEPRLCLNRHFAG